MQLKFSLKSPSRWRRHKYDQDPATVSSTVNYRLQNLSPRLASSLTVNAIINTIRKRHVVHRLDLGDSSLGDADCVRLFGFLSSPAGLHCREGLTELLLTKNVIGSRGLLAVATFLRSNMVLRKLCLSGNPLTTDPDVIADFADALNSSRLCILRILLSGSLGDAFVCSLLPQLTTPYLRELNLSAINMTQAVVPTLVDYVKSGRCRLERLHCNANSLTLSGARKIVNAIKENHSLQDVKLDDSHIDEHAAAAAAAGEDRTLGWQGCNQALSAVCHRNSAHLVQVKDESLALLRYSRALFLRSRMCRAINCIHTLASLPRRGRNSQSFDIPLSFFSLPVELQQEIISYLAPSLSYQQCMRIVHFAADVTTLSHSDCHSDGIRSRKKQPGMLRKSGLSCSQRGSLFEGTWRPPVWWECHCSADVRSSCKCLRRWKSEMRDIWLSQVSCDVYGYV